MAPRTKKGTGRGLLRQGDVLLVPVDALPSKEDRHVREIEHIDGRLILAEGEATGHAHAIEGEGARLLTVSGLRRFGGGGFLTPYLIVDTPQTLRHEEHDPVPLSPGIYEVRRQREYRPSRPMWVRD